jgi:hypothetical protein
MRSNIIRRSRSNLLLIIVLMTGGMVLVGCATPIPMAQEAPDLNYKVTRPVVVGVVDERDVLAEGKPPTFIGRAHGSFGIPRDMETYSWFVSDKARKGQTLAQALEERIVVGLNDEGWQVTGANFTEPPTIEEAVSILAAGNAQRLLKLSLTKWFVSINLSWVTAFNFDWGYQLEVFDPQGSTVASISESGRDVVDMKSNDSYQNQIKMAYRARLIQILERPEVRAALER